MFVLPAASTPHIEPELCRKSKWLNNLALFNRTVECSATVIEVWTAVAGK